MDVPRMRSTRGEGGSGRGSERSLQWNIHSGGNWLDVINVNVKGRETEGVLVGRDFGRCYTIR